MKGDDDEKISHKFPSLYTISATIMLHDIIRKTIHKIIMVNFRHSLTHYTCDTTMM